MHEEIINTLFTLCDTANQLDLLYKDEFGGILKEYSYSEMHCIDSIGKLQNPNITKIARHLNLTKAGVSKIIKKLTDKKAVETYKITCNKKETYYKLTKTGLEVFEKHLKMHQNWHEIDKSFFEKFKKSDLETTRNVLTEYAKLLQTRLENIKENLK